MSTTIDDAPSAVRATPLDPMLLAGGVLAVVLVAIYGTIAVSAAVDGDPLHPWVHVVAMNGAMTAVVVLVARWWRRRADRQAERQAERAERQTAEIVRHLDTIELIVSAAFEFAPAELVAAPGGAQIVQLPTGPTRDALLSLSRRLSKIDGDNPGDSSTPAN
jgi:type VI protein secretion system component VasK